MNTTAINPATVKSVNSENKAKSIFAFTKKHGGFFSSSRDKHGAIKVGVRTNRLENPIFATGADFATACISVMDKYESLIKKLNA